MKANSELVIPDHLLDDSVDESAPTPIIDIPTLLPDALDEWDSPTDIELPRRSHRRWLIAGAAFLVIAGGSAIAAYLSVAAKRHTPPPQVAASPAPVQIATPTPVVTRIITEDPIVVPETESIPMPPAPLAVIETPPPSTRPAPARPTAAAVRVAVTNQKVATPAPTAKSSAAPTAKSAATPQPAAPGILLLGAKPPCSIHIDGRDTGMVTPQRSIELSPGSHRVTLLNDSYSIKESFDVTLESGKQIKVIKDLSAAIRPAE